MCQILGFDASKEAEILCGEGEIEQPNPAPHSIVEPAAKRVCRYSLKQCIRQWQRHSFWMCRIPAFLSTGTPVLYLHHINCNINSGKMTRQDDAQHMTEKREWEEKRQSISKL